VKPTLITCVYAGDKSPVYPKDQVFPPIEPTAAET
jgi:hypothetical protein